jgi:hypothetical protein
LSNPADKDEDSGPGQGGGEASLAPPSPIDPKENNPQTDNSSNGSEKRHHTSLEKTAFGIAIIAAIGTIWQAYVANDAEHRNLRAYLVPVVFRVDNLIPDTPFRSTLISCASPLCRP